MLSFQQNSINNLNHHKKWYKRTESVCWKQHHHRLSIHPWIVWDLEMTEVFSHNASFSETKVLQRVPSLQTLGQKVLGLWEGASGCSEQTGCVVCGREARDEFLS